MSQGEAAAGAGAGNNRPRSNAEELENLRTRLPNPDEIRARLLDLRFFALCPNGKRIPVEQVCEEYSRDPRGLAYRTFENRLVLVIQAVFPDETIYWQQAFYMSTGMNSGMPSTWLPFDGILLQGQFASYMLPSNEPAPKPKPSASPFQFTFLDKAGKSKVFRFSEPPKPKPGALKPRKELKGSAWFSKYAFANLRANAPSSYHSVPTRQQELTLEMRKNILLNEIYGEVYLPEGNYLSGEYRFNRFGCMSYALASHRIGSTVFKDHIDRGTPLTMYLFPETNKNSLNTAFKTELSKSSVLQPCFTEMSTSYPITSPNIINQYIETHKAFSYMNTFRQEGIFPPGLSFINTPIETLGYSMPLQNHETLLTTKIHEIWKDYKFGKLSLEEVRAIFENPRAYFRKIEREVREDVVLANDPRIVFKINKGELNRPSGRFYGGKSRKKRSKSLRRKRTYRRL